MDRPSPHTREDQRLINRRQQGDLGEASAIEWLTSVGAHVLIPFGHSPDFDLVAEIDHRLLRVQVKTSTNLVQTPNGNDRWAVALATNGGNQSWSGQTKYFDPVNVELLFVLVGDGRRWVIPAHAVEGRRQVRLGGLRYSEFEVTPGIPIMSLVYGETDARPTIDPPGERRRGRVGLDCKSSAKLLSGFESLLPHHPSSSHPTERAGDHGDSTSFEHSLGRASQVMMRRNRQMSMPKRAYDEAGLNAGDRMRVRADGPGRVVFERIPEPPQIEELPLDPS